MSLRAKLYCIIGLVALLSLAWWRGRQDSCGPFPDWHTSPYVLPYYVGSTYYVSQANCSAGGHHGAYKYAYDFVMPIGTTVTAARAGVVAAIPMKFCARQPGQGAPNRVKDRHIYQPIAA